LLPIYRPNSKEALALINGISMTTALGAMAVVRVERVLDATILATAMTMEAMGTDAGCIDDRLLRARNHPGGITVGERLRTVERVRVHSQYGQLPR
jgi:histidine ammonia-lyase